MSKGRICEACEVWSPTLLNCTLRYMMNVVLRHEVELVLRMSKS